MTSPIRDHGQRRLKLCWQAHTEARDLYFTNRKEAAKQAKTMTGGRVQRTALYYSPNTQHYYLRRADIIPVTINPKSEEERTQP